MTSIIINQQPSSSSSSSSHQQTTSSQLDYHGAPITLVTRSPTPPALAVTVTEEGDGEPDLDLEENADRGYVNERSTLINDETMVVIVSQGGGGGGPGGKSPNVIVRGGGVVTPPMSLLQVQQQPYADVCRICHCGPNTLATPTPQVLTPVTSPKKFQTPSTSNLTPSAVSIQLTRSMSGSSSPPPPPPSISIPSSPPQSVIIMHTTPPSPPLKKKVKAAPPPPTPDYNLISPCICSGSLKYVHQCCLQHWIRASNNTACELCKYPYELRSKFKPIWKWESLPMSSREKKRVVCSALFHTVALACVVWSLYVLIDRTIEELTHSDLEWQFWTKIIVEAIGCLGAGILTYVWGKSYVSLFVKCISFNRSFVILGKEHRNSIPDQFTPQKETEPVLQIQTQPQLPGTSAAGQSPTELTQLMKQL